MTAVTLFAGGSAAARETAIVAAIDPALRTALVLEGMPGGQKPFDSFTASSQIQIIRIAPGCPCCVGNLTMRVTLNRILRRPPQALHIGLASAHHLAAMRCFLTQPPYDRLLQLNQDIIL